MKLVKHYIFTGFGFDVLLENVEIKTVKGHEFPDIDMRELKLLTAKSIIRSKFKLTGKKLKFLRTFLGLSFQKLAEILDVPASTLRLWEDKGQEITGLSVAQERHFRIFAIESILGSEKRFFEKDIVMAEAFEVNSEQPLNLLSIKDYHYLPEA